MQTKEQDKAKTEVNDGSGERMIDDAGKVDSKDRIEGALENLRRFAR